MAVIKAARVVAAHEGIAELIVNIEYENGGVTEVALDQMATARLMESCEANSLDDLCGHSWEKVREALMVSYNRHLN